MIVKAQYEEKPSTTPKINYNANGGVTAPPDAWIIYNVGAGRPEIDPQYYDSATGTVVSNVIPVYSGHVFLGWTTSQGSGVNVLPDQLFGDGYSGVHNLYAVWDVNTGSIEDIEQTVYRGEAPASGDVATISATWTVSAYTPGAVNCTGRIAWDITKNAGNEAYAISKIVFYSGSTRLGEAYDISGELGNLVWQIDNPPSKMIVYWAEDSVQREFSVSIEGEDIYGPSPEASGCSAKIMPTNATLGSYYDDTVITLVATAGADWQFMKWTKDNAEVSTDREYNIIVSESNAGDYVAVFKDLNGTYHLSLLLSPANTTGITLSGAGDYHVGDSITLTATVTDSSGFDFQYWKLKGYDYPGNLDKTKNPYTFKLTPTLVSMSMEWIAVCKQTAYYQVLGRVNIAQGQITLSPSKAGYAAGEPLSVIVKPNSQYTDYEKYACLHLDSSSGERIKNQHLAFESLVAGFTHTYNVNEDNVWTAYFERIHRADLYLDYYPTESHPSQPDGYINVFSGEAFNFAQPLPKPTRAGYYFKGWFTSRDDGSSSSGEKITDDSQVPAISGDSINLYAHWVNNSTKYFITGEASPSDIGTVTVSEPANGEYFVAGETCTISYSKNPEASQAKYFEWEATQYYDGTGYQDIETWEGGSEGPVTFTVGEQNKWEYAGDNPGEKKIKIRYLYKELASTLSVFVVPSDLSRGDAIASAPRCTHTEGATVTAYPNTGIGAAVAKWERKIGDGAWETLEESGNSLYVEGENDVVNGNRVAQTVYVRVTFGLTGGVLHYNLDGGAPAISDQSYTTEKAFDLDSTVPTKSGYVFSGWRQSSSTSPLYQPGKSVSFSELETTLDAIWYQTPQTITDIRHWDATADAEYSGDTATVSAQVSDIQRTEKGGLLKGKLTWSVAMPASTETTGYPKFVKISVGTGGDVANILSSTEQNNSEGIEVFVDSAFQVSTDWKFTVYYSNGNLVAVFLPNGGVQSPPDVSFVWGQSFRIPTEVPVREGYVFCGWAYDDSTASPDDPSLAQPGSLFSGEDFEIFDNCTFYAVWTPGVKLRTVYHNATTGTNSTEPLADAIVWATENDKKVHWKISNVRDGYDLVLAETVMVTDASGVVVGLGSGETGEFVYHNTSESPSSQWTATIDFTQNAYVIAYNTQGGTPAIPSQTVPKDGGSSVKITTIRPSKGDDEFLGWSTDPNAAEATYAPGTNISVSSNITLYAIYQENSDSSGGGGESDSSPGGEGTLTVYGRPDNPDNGSVAPSKVTYNNGDTVSFTATAKTGYKFAYWVDAQGGAALSTSATYSFIGTSAQDGHTFIAMFTAMDEQIPTDLIYYVPTDLLMSYQQKLIWNDDGLKGCGDGTTSSS